MTSPKPGVPWMGPWEGYLSQGKEEAIMNARERLERYIKRAEDEYCPDVSKVRLARELLRSIWLLQNLAEHSRPMDIAAAREFLKELSDDRR